MFDHHHHLSHGCQVIFFGLCCCLLHGTNYSRKRIAFLNPDLFLPLKATERIKNEQEMNEKAQGGYRELCSWLTIRHTLMIIGWEDVSGAMSKRCTRFSKECISCSSLCSSLLFFSLPRRGRRAKQRVSSSLGGGCDYLGGQRGKTFVFPRHCIAL